MTIFMDTGGGDYYAGPTREAVIAAILADDDTLEVEAMFEVPGTTKMRESDENEMPTGGLITFDEEYDESLGSYCIASENF